MKNLSQVWRPPAVCIQFTPGAPNAARSRHSNNFDLACLGRAGIFVAPHHAPQAGSSLALVRQLAITDTARLLRVYLHAIRQGSVEAGVFP